MPDTRYGAAVSDEAWAAAAATGLSLTRVRTYAPDASDAAEVVRELAEYGRRAQALKDERRALARQNDAAARRRLKRLATLDTLGTLHFDAVLLADGGARLRQVAPLLPYYDIDPAKIRVLGTGLWEDPATLGEAALSGRLVCRPRPGGTARLRGSLPPGLRRTPRARSPPLPMTRPRWRLRSRAQAPRSSSRPLETAAASSARTGCFASTTRESRNGASRYSRSPAAAKTVVVSPAPTRFDTGAGDADGG